MTNYYEQMFGPREDSLQHYGVKGMRWGVRRDNDSSSSSSSSKPSSREIKDARKRVLSSRQELISQQSSRGKRWEMRFMGELSSNLPKSYLANPDRQTAFRMTKGEKFLNGFAAVATGGASIPSSMVIASVYKRARNDQKLASS